MDGLSPAGRADESLGPDKDSRCTLDRLVRKPFDRAFARGTDRRSDSSFERNPPRADRRNQAGGLLRPRARRFTPDGGRRHRIRENARLRERRVLPSDRALPPDAREHPLGNRDRRNGRAVEHGDRDGDHLSRTLAGEILDPLGRFAAGPLPVVRLGRSCSRRRPARRASRRLVRSSGPHAVHRGPPFLRRARFQLRKIPGWLSSLFSRTCSASRWPASSRQTAIGA